MVGKNRSITQFPPPAAQTYARICSKGKSLGTLVGTQFYKTFLCGSWETKVLIINSSDSLIIGINDDF